MILYLSFYYSITLCFYWSIRIYYTILLYHYFNILLFSLSYHSCSIIPVIMSSSLHLIVLLLYDYIIISLYYSANILPPAPPGHRCCLTNACPFVAVLSVAMSSLEGADNSTAEDCVSNQDHQSVVNVGTVVLPDTQSTADVYFTAASSLAVADYTAVEGAFHRRQHQCLRLLSF